MSYYLHYKIGRPLMTYSNGSCTGWSQRDSVHDFTFNFSDFDTTAWAQMALINPCIDGYQVGEQKVGILMAYIGSRVHMDYGYGSSAETDSLVDFFAENGVSCVMANYNASTVRNQLTNNMPVILRADSEAYYDNYFDRIFGNLSYKTGHAWIADGYEDTKVHYKYYYQWFAKDDPLPEVDLLDTEHIQTEELDLITNSYLIMNWGYDGLWNESRYSFDIDSYWDANLEGHQYQKKMIYNFSVQ